MGAPATPPRFDLARVRAWAVIVVTCLAVLSPLVPELRGRNDDSFPLSWFPMFAKTRPDFERPVYVVGRSPDGKSMKIDVKWWTTGGFNQGRNMLTKTVAAGPDELDYFCAKLAKQVTKKRGRRWGAVEQVAIVRGKFDRARFFGEGKHEPLDEKTLYSCHVPR
ncbi:MAG: hypothetical protein Q8P41_13790 [Pseudomonadota bacterium]|nr:hypothetical protein [Pseudomonadota bacterium]